MDGSLKNLLDEDHSNDSYWKQQGGDMANLAFDHARDDRNCFGEINKSTSPMFSGDRGMSPSVTASSSHLDFSSNQNGNGDIRLSMPAPKRTLPTSIVDSLNEDSLFFSGGQNHVFGAGFSNQYLQSEVSASQTHSNNNLYMLGSEQSEIDPDFNKRGPRSFSLGEDSFPLTAAAPSADFLFNRPSSTPVSASFASSSSQILQYQNGSPYSHNQHEVGSHNSALLQQYEHDIATSRAVQQLQQPQTYSQHVSPSNLQIHLADIDRRMEIRRGKSAGPGTSSYDLSPPSHGLDNNNASSMRQLQHQQQLLNARNVNINPPFRAQAQLEAMMMQQRPASTPLPMSLSQNHMHHIHQPSAEHSKPHGPPLLNLCGLEDSSVEDIVAKSCRDILIDAASHSLKAVELANTLRARVGTEVLAHIRERWGGLLSLLERHTHIFRVERIPKNDLVTLVGGGVPSSGGSQSAQSAALRGGRSLSTPIFMSQNQGQGGLDLIQGQGSFYSGSSGAMPYSSSAPPTAPNNIIRTLSPPASASLTSFHSHYGIPGSGDHMMVGGGVGGGEGIVSRCLHVGNVPANMTETQLLRELERYGDVDCLKLVSQRSRRFAFVSFRTIEQAISAKQRMTRVHPWKSAISFAHKESQSMNPSQALSGSSGSPAPYSYPDQQQQQQQAYYNAPTSPSHSMSGGQNQNQVQNQMQNSNHGQMHSNQTYQQAHQQLLQQQQQQQQQSISILQKQQEEEEELNQQFTRSLSVPPLAPSLYQRYNMDSVFGTGSNSALDAMLSGGSSFASGAGLGLIRPASTGSVNLDGNPNLYGSSLSSLTPYPYSPSAANLSSMGVGAVGGSRVRDSIPTHYVGFDFQGSESSNTNSSSQSLNMVGGVASLSRIMGSPMAVASGRSGSGPAPGLVPLRQASMSHNAVDDGNLGLDLDYDYEFDQLLTGTTSLSVVEKERVQGLVLGSGSGPLVTSELGPSQSQGQGIMIPSSSSGGIGGTGVDFVLRRLCDDTYVPTQPWPVRWEVDAYYCSAVIAQLQQFGGATTISKLRGFLRSRVNATDNIKSVPLKAMLSGYPGFFTVRSNQVTLAPDPLFAVAMGSADIGIGGLFPVGAVAGGGTASGGGAGRGHIHSLSQGTGDFDIRTAPGLSPGSSPPSPSFGYGLQ